MLSGKESVSNTGDMSSFLHREDLVEWDMATHSSILAWGIPWTEEPDGLKSTGLQESDMT